MPQKVIYLCLSRLPAKYYLDTAMQLNPFDANFNYQKGAFYYYQRKYDEALHFYSKSTAIDPEFLFSHIQSAATLLLKGQEEEALQLASVLQMSALLGVENAEPPNLITKITCIVISAERKF